MNVPLSWQDADALAVLAALAFGADRSRRESEPNLTRHLAFLPLAALELDLSDPQQREFGDYELLEQLGQGGMGVVYRARQVGLDREVAIKLLSAGPWASGDFIERFRREAQSAARLQHPNIVAIHEFGSHDELNYFSMDLVRGPNLAQTLSARGRLPPKEAAALVRRIAEALDYAHRLGVLHLDLKPGNVLIDEHGEPQIADFGLARRLDDSLGADSDEVSGTPNYMAPEQIELKRHRLSPATDLYGLGAILYELLSGWPPYVADTPEQTLKLVLAGNIRRLRRDDDSIPEDLESICLTCLATDPAWRYPNARALADDLGRFLEGRAVSVRTLTTAQRMQRWAKREPKLATAVGIAAISLLAGIFATSLQWQRAERSADAARQQLWRQRVDEAANAIRERGPLEALPAMVQNLSEQEAVGATQQAESSRVRIGSLLAESPALVDAIDTGEAIIAIALDPAGQWVATAGASGRVRSFDLATGKLRWQTDTRGMFPSWPENAPFTLKISGDGKLLIVSGYEPPGTPASSSADQILLDAATGAVRMPPGDRFPDFIGANFSSDGAYAIVRSGAQEVPGRAKSQLVRTSDWKAIGTAMPSQADGSLAPGGDSLARSRDDGRSIEVLAPSGLAVRHRYSRGDAILTALRYSQDGRRLAMGYEDGQTVVLDIASGRALPLSPKFDASVGELSFSEDGAWLAASAGDSEGSIRVWDAATGAAVSEKLRLQGELTYFMTQAARHEAPALSLDRGQRSLLAVNSSRAAVWRLPEAPGAATVVLERPFYPRQMQKKATVMLPRLGLMAVGASDGSLRLWRWREHPPLPGAGPWMASSETNTASDGRLAVIVDGNTATAVDAATGRAAGPAIAYPQAPAYAVLTPDGASLIATAGPRLYAHDPRRGTQRFAIALDANPNALLVSPRGDHLLLGHNAHEGGRNLQVLESYALPTGRRTGRIALWPPERLFNFAGDGSTVFAWHVQALDALDAKTLRPLHPALWPEAPAAKNGKAAAQHEILTEGSFVSHLWIDAASGDGRDAWLLSAGKQNLLQPMDQATGRIGKGWPLPSVGENLQWLPGARTAVLLPEADRVEIYARDGRHSNLPVRGVNGYAGFALSGDGKRLAVALDQGVQVFDAADGGWLSAPLRVADASDRIFGLAIDERGERLLLRSRERRIWALGLDADRRPLTELAELVSLLRPADAATPAMDARVRAVLHARDPGPPQSHARTPAAAHTVVAGDPYPAAVRGGMSAIDLRPWCNLDLATSQRRIFRGLRLDRVFSPGRQRLLGIDYDVRCAIMASTSTGPAHAAPMPARIAGIAVNPAKIATLHLLMTSGTRPRERNAAPLAAFEIAYRDGSRERLPILYRKQLREWWADSTEGGSRLAFVAFGSQLSTPSTYPPFLFEVRLQNPHPEREVASVALEAVGRDWSQAVLLAMTLQPAAAP